MDEVVSKAVMKRISADLDAFQLLKVTYKQTVSAYDSLKQEFEEVKFKLLLVSSANDKLVKDLAAKVLELEKVYKMMEGYKNLLSSKSIELTKMKKWRGKYYALGSVKLITIAIPIAGFLVGSYLIMEAVK